MITSFANPALWVALPAIAVPLVIHLVARARPPVVAFPWIALLLQARRESQRVRRPREWLVLLLRTLFVAALLGAFLQPLLRGSAEIAGTRDEKTVILLVDRSASMGAMEHGRTRLAAAVEQAVGILDGAGSAALANVIWVQAVPDGVFPEAGRNLDFLRDALGAASVVPEPAARDAAWSMAVAAAAAGGGAREIHVISDFQQTAWGDWQPETPPDTRLFLIQTADTDVPNAAITALETSPAHPAAGEPVEVRCTVRNFSAEPMRTSLFLDVGASRLAREIDLPPWSETVEVFPTVFERAGDIALSAGIEEDRFPGDDHRFAVAQVREALVVGLHPPPADDGGHPWERAARALGTLRTVPVETPGQSLPLDHLLVESWDGGHVDALLELAEAGTAVYVQPGGETPGPELARLFGLPEPPGAVRAELASGDGWAVDISAPDATVFNLFRSGDYGHPIPGRAVRRVRPDGHWFSSAGVRVLAEYTDGVPALARRDTAGAPVYWLNLPLNEADGSWVAEPNFVSFLAELWQASRARGAAPGRETPPGLPVAFEPASEIAADSVVLIDRSGELVDLAPRADAGTRRLTSAQALPPGIYRWQGESQTLHTSVVNFPPEESDLRLTDPATATAATAAAPPVSAVNRDGHPLWPWLAAAAFLFLLAEALTIRQIARPQPAT